MEYEGFISGKEFDNNKHENFTFIIDDKINGDPATVGLYKEFYKNTLGEMANTKKSFTYKMPDDFVDTKIAGKEIEYKIRIKNIYLNSDNLRSILILANSNSSLAFPFKIFPDGSFNFCEFTFLPLTITS